MNETEPDAILPTDSAGTVITRLNALKHDILSGYTVLPWKDADEYHALVAAIAAESCPQGSAEEHLVEELAGILWAQAAAARRGYGSLARPRGCRPCPL